MQAAQFEMVAVRNAGIYDFALIRPNMAPINIEAKIGLIRF